MFDEKIALPCFIAILSICSSYCAPLDKADDSDEAAYFLCNGKPADIFFLLDSSTSIYPKDFTKQLTFVQNLAQSLPISPEETRVGVGSFASTYKTHITFDKYSNISDLVQGIGAIKQLYGNTNTGKALEFVRNGVFTQARGGAAKLAVVLTDGRSMYRRRTNSQAQLLKNSGVVVFAIGVGSKTNLTELRNIGSMPSSTFVYEVQDFDALDGIKKTIKETLAYQICKVEPLKHEPYCAPSTETDVMFVFDAAAVGSRNARHVHNFIGDVVSNFGNMEDKSLQAGVLSGYCEDNNVYLGDYNDKAKLVNKFTNAEYKGLDQIAHQLHRHSYDESRGGRKGARRIAVVFVDDSTEKKDRLATELGKAKDKGIEIFLVSIGNQSIMESLGGVVNKPEDIANVPSFKDLELIKDEYIDTFCQGLKLRETAESEEE